MATTITFAEPKANLDAQLSTDPVNGVELVNVEITLSGPMGMTHATTSVSLSSLDRVLIITQWGDDHVQTKLDPNEVENDVKAIVAEVLRFPAQTLIVPTDDLVTAASIAHEVLAGARYNWG